MDGEDYLTSDDAHHTSQQQSSSDPKVLKKYKRNDTDTNLMKRAIGRCFPNLNYIFFLKL